MTDKKLLEVFKLYAFWMRNECATATGQRADENKFEVWSAGDGDLRSLYPRYAAHIIYMCETAAGFVDQGRREKAMRWLGFIQGVLVSNGFCSLDEVGKHSMPDPEGK